MDIKRLISDLEEIRQKCSDKMTDLDEVDEQLGDIIDELKLSKGQRVQGFWNNAENMPL